MHLGVELGLFGALPASQACQVMLCHQDGTNRHLAIRILILKRSYSTLYCELSEFLLPERASRLFSIN